ncbi:ethyl tert-butyl ether degradation protein EthD [Sesbania bispinosa]|nr:ethyl tert-butyl ether degradation protein EthD [Sesbania bispinosa]
MGIKIRKYMIEAVYNTRSIISSPRLPGQGVAEPEEAMQNVAIRATVAESFPHRSGRRGC